MLKKQPNTDLIVDANGLFAKGYYAASAPDSDLRHDEDGFLTASFKCFFSMLKLETGIPERILFSFDGKPKTVKPRPPKPADWHPKLDQFQEIIKEAFGAQAHVLHPDHESDDTVATVACRMADLGRRVIVVSGDKDLQQLRGANVDFFCLNRKRLMTEREICERWNVNQPIHVAVALAIIGDPKDGVNGVDKMGAKAVQKIFDRLPKDAPLEEVVEQVAKGMSEKQRAQFYESLDYTLLHLDVQTEAVPVPFLPASRLSLDGRAGFEWERGVSSLDPEAALDAVDQWNP